MVSRLVPTSKEYGGYDKVSWRRALHAEIARVNLNNELVTICLQKS